MKKYLIRKHCEASEIVTIAQDRVQNYYYGNKMGYLSRNFIPIDAEIKTYGYNSIEEAKPQFDILVENAEAENAVGRWNVSITIEEFEVE